MIEKHIAVSAAALLGDLRFYPTDAGARAAVADILMEMCESEQAAKWLVRRMGQLYNEWPGPRELRAVYCSRFRPMDGVEADTSDPRFLESGIPPGKVLPDGGKHLRLPPGRVASADPELEGMVMNLAKRKSLVLATKGRKR